METLPAWIFAGVTAVIFITFAGYNGAIAVASLVARTRVRSYAPIVGGFAGMGAVLAAPVGSLSDRLPWSVVPLLLDIGCLPYMVAVLWVIRMDRGAK